MAHRKYRPANSQINLTVYMYKVQNVYVRLVAAEQKSQNILHKCGVITIDSRLRIVLLFSKYFTFKMGSVMKLKICLVIVTSGLVLSSANANSADLQPAPTVAASPFYVSLFGGASWLNDVFTEFNIETPPPGNYRYDQSYDHGFLFGGALGYNFNDWLRTEVEVSHISYDGNNVQINFTEDGGIEYPTVEFSPEFSVTYTSVLGNLWLGLDMLTATGDPSLPAGATPGGFSPYVGGGLGVAFVETEGDELETDETTAFAWQLGAGVRWNFDSSVGLDVGYRFRGVNDVGFDFIGSGNLYSHNVIAGLTFSF
jgi:opacity protein-like surface antigen